MVCALTSTSPAFGRGVGTSTYSRTDGSPVRVSRMAFIRRLIPAPPRPPLADARSADPPHARKGSRGRDIAGSGVPTETLPLANPGGECHFLPMIPVDRLGLG